MMESWSREAWDQFIYAWGQICEAMRYQEMYEKHLAEAEDGTPLAAALSRVGTAQETAQDLIDYARWEAWEAIMSLEPWVPRDRGLKPGEHLVHVKGRELPHVQDGYHVSCCVSRLEFALRRLEKLLK